MSVYYVHNVCLFKDDICMRKCFIYFLGQKEEKNKLLGITGNKKVNV